MTTLGRGHIASGARVGEKREPVLHFSEGNLAEVRVSLKKAHFKAVADITVHSAKKKSQVLNSLLCSWLRVLRTWHKQHSPRKDQFTTGKLFSRWWTEEQVLKMS